MSKESACVECQKAFIPYVTGHNFHCAECHTMILNGMNNLNDTKEQKIEKETSIPEKKLSTNEELLQNFQTQYQNVSEITKHEKHYHSLKFNKRYL